MKIANGSSHFRHRGQSASPGVVLSILLLAACLPTTSLKAEEGFTKVIHWKMEELNANGEIPNAIEEGPYAEATLVLNGAELVDDQVRGKVLCFDGVDDTAESLSLWQGHKGVRVTMWVKNGSPGGQSVLLAAGPFRIHKMASSVRFTVGTDQMPDWRENTIGAGNLTVGEWRQMTAQFDPGLHKAMVECDGQFNEKDFPAGDTLGMSNFPFQLGNALNQHLNGCIDEVVVEVKD